MPQRGRFIPFRKSHAVLSFAVGASLGATGLILERIGQSTGHLFSTYAFVMIGGGVFTFLMYLGRNADRVSAENDDFVDDPRLHDTIVQELDRDMSDLAGRIPGTFYGDFARRND